MCGSSSGWSKVSLCVLCVAVAVHIAGWATVSWMAYSTSNTAVSIDVGLWKMESCSSGACDTTSIASQYETDAFNAVRALSTITFCLAVFCVVLLLIYTVAHIQRRHTFALVIMIMLYIAGGLSFCAMVVFVATIPSPFDVSWSLGLTVIAMTLILIAGTLMIPDAFEPDYRRHHDDYYDHRKGRPQSRGITPLSFRDNINRW